MSQFCGIQKQVFEVCAPTPLIVGPIFRVPALLCLRTPRGKPKEHYPHRNWDKPEVTAFCSSCAKNCLVVPLTALSVRRQTPCETPGTARAERACARGSYFSVRAVPKNAASRRLAPSAIVTWCLLPEKRRSRIKFVCWAVLNTQRVARYRTSSNPLGASWRTPARHRDSTAPPRQTCTFPPICPARPPRSPPASVILVSVELRISTCD